MAINQFKGYRKILAEYVEKDPSLANAECTSCGKPFIAEGIDNIYCSRLCSSPIHGFKAGRKMGYIKDGLEPVLHPTLIDIAWASGLFEGEGNCHFHAMTTRAAITQKDTWILYRLKELFGGSINTRKNRDCSQWSVSGALARGFLMTIYWRLSPRRKDQVRKALKGGA